MKAIILAAGAGTRLRPLTDTLPKALIPVAGVPLLEIVIRRLAGAGYRELIINLHHHAAQIREFLARNHHFGLDITFSDESNRLLDTGGALRHMKPLIGNDPRILLHNVDILTNLDYRLLTETHDQSDALATLAVLHRTTTRNLLVNPQGILCGWEYPERHLLITSRESTRGLSPIAYSGIAVLSREAFSLLPDEEVFGFMSWILNLSSTDRIRTWDQSPAFWYEVGRLDSLEQASRELSIDPSHPDFLIRK